ADFKTFLNPDSLHVLQSARVEPSLAGAEPGDPFQFERQGYFTVDLDSKPSDGNSPDGSDDPLVFNRTVTLRDTWAKITGDSERASEAAEKAARKAAIKAQQREQSRAAAEDDEPPLTAEEQAAFERYQADGLSAQDARLLAVDPELGAFFAAAREVCDRPQPIANWIVNELLRELKETRLADLSITGTGLGELVALIDDGTISGKIGKDVFAEMLTSGDGPRAIVEAKGWQQVTDDAGLAPLIDRVFAEHADKVEQYRAGKTALFGFFVGQVMRASRGQANPQRANELLKVRLG
ncbi:MAG: glutamine--tRNA ligase, partial [Acidobacteriota bacterium]